MAPKQAQSVSQAVEVSSTASSVIGALAGVIEVALQQPHVAWKNAIQDKRPVPLNPRLLYRGVLINAGSMAPINAVQFGANTVLAKRFAGQGGQLSELGAVTAAATAGAMSAAISGPAELIMIQQQKKGGSLAFQAQQIVGQHGSTAFARALAPTAVRESIYTATYLGLNPVLRQKLIQAQPQVFEERPMAAMVVASIASGLFAAGMTQPFDTIKTRMQANLENPAFQSVYGTARAMWQEGGAKVLWSGLLPRALRIVGAVFILGESRDRLSSAYLALQPVDRSPTTVVAESLPSLGTPLK